MPHKCPVCDGTGLVSRPPHIAGDVESWADSSSGPYQCKGCNGSGIVWENPAETLARSVPPSGDDKFWIGDPPDQCGSEATSTQADPYQELRTTILNANSEGR